MKGFICRWGYVGVLLAGIPVAGLRAAEPGWAAEAGARQLGSPEAREVSGMAATVAGDAGFWLINDSGGGSLLFLAGPDGRDRGKVRVAKAGNRDWEDLAGFMWKGKPYLLIADVGDNDAKRKACTLYVVREPELPAAGGVVDGVVEPEWKITFRYPDGARDCEAVAVDAAAGKVLLVSKRTRPPEVYELPLVPEAGREVVARNVGTTAVKQPPGGFPHPFGSQPTGLALSPDGRMAAVLSYVSVFLFPRNAGESWAEAMARNPVVLPRHGLPQAEALAFSRDGRSLSVVSEGLRSRLICYRRQP